MDFHADNVYTRNLWIHNLGTEYSWEFEILYNSELSRKNSAPVGDPSPTGAESRPSEPAGATDSERLLSLGEYISSLRDLVEVIKRRLWIVGMVTVLFTGVVFTYSLLQTPMYESSSKILVGQERTTTEQRPVENVTNLQQLTQTMTEAVNSRPVAEAVIQQLDLQMTADEFLEEHLSVEQINETQFIRVTYRDSSPERAEQVANAIASVFSEQVSEVSASASAITAAVWEPAVAPSEPMSPKPVRNGLLALMLGLMLGTGLAFLLEYLDDSWRSPEEAELISGVPTFGVIPEFSTPTDEKKGQLLR